MLLKRASIITAFLAAGVLFAAAPGLSFRTSMLSERQLTSGPLPKNLDNNINFSPDGRFLLVSGQALYVIRPDGTGRVELTTPSMPLALGGIPDWTVG